MNTHSMLDELLMIYQQIKPRIEARLEEFQSFLARSDEQQVFAELAFCLFTPQSNAISCHRSVERLIENGLLYNGNASDIASQMRGVRFHNTKALRVIEARDRFTLNGRLAIKAEIIKWKEPFALREWLVRNIKGLGYKEATHFLRNIGLGEDMAILDRHVLREICRLNLINEVPSSLSGRRYLEIEKQMVSFSQLIDVPVSHLDLLLWYRRTGFIFK